MTAPPGPFQPAPPPLIHPRAADGTSELGSDSGALHGRMLRVARLATIGEMAAGVAHELNQPLTAIANYANACERLLARPNADLTDVRQALREIASQAVRAGEILRRLRTLARSQPIERVSADINSVITEILQLMQSDAHVHGAQLLLELADGLPPVSIDRVQIQHVILNLVRNGLEALAAKRPDSPQVKIGSRDSGNGVEVSVCDNGPGLAPQTLERVFDPFFSTKDSGTGLGLPSSHTIVRAHGGTLGYRANEPNGACFYVLLPAEEATE